MFPHRKFALGLVLAGLAAVPGVAQAGAWQRHHPARTEINHRLRHQEHRITEERREGEISKGQAHALRGDLHAIRGEERADARADGNHGHLTHAQVRDLNGQLNASSRTIGR